MSYSSILEISEKLTAEKRLLTNREYFLVNRIKCRVSDRLNDLLRKNANSTALSFSFSNSNNPGTHSIGFGVELTLTLFHRTCQFFLTSILALEIANRYLDKTPPAVDRPLNSEELSVLALVVTLTIAELREEGITGIYLRDVRSLESEFTTNSEDLILEETNFKQLLIVRVEDVTFEQVRERAKLMLLNNWIEMKVLSTSHLANLEIDAEVRSFTTLLSLKPGLRWKLGKEVPIAISLDEELVGYGELQIESNQ